MTRSKRIFDLLLAFLLLVVLMPVMIVIAALIRLVDGAPVFYISERMRGPDRAFGLIKFRTMKNARQDRGVTGGDKAARITRTGRLLRRSRMDELPQVFNILRGDMSFVGPRPPLRQYVDRFPDLYRRVLASRPGVTGLASLKYRHHEEKLLAVFVPDSEGEHAAQALHHIRTELLEQVYQHLGVGLGAEAVPFSDQKLAQLLVIVNFPVENRPDGPVFVGDGLLSGVQVDNGKTPVSQPHLIFEVVTVVVRTAMANHVGHFAN